MCGRFTLRTPQKQLAEQLHLPPELQLPLRFNVAPTQQVLAIRQATPPDGRLPNGYGFTLLRWGLVPSWAKDPNVGNRMINARSETVAEKPSFRYAFKNRRCLSLPMAITSGVPPMVRNSLFTSIKPTSLPLPWLAYGKHGNQSEPRRLQLGWKRARS